MNDIQITDAELEIMKVLWNERISLTSSDIRSRLNKDWERTTVLTLLSRLSEKGAISVEKENRSYRYKSLISKDEYGLSKTRSILDNLYNGSIKGMMAALCDSQGLTEQEIRELQEILDKGVK
jgi:BlaI family penicillinase repressor